MMKTKEATMTYTYDELRPKYRFRGARIEQDGPVFVVRWDLVFANAPAERFDSLNAAKADIREVF